MGVYVASDETKLATLVSDQPDHRHGLADRIEALAVELRTIYGETSQLPGPPPSIPALAAKVYSARRKVDAILGLDGIAVSPGWDILLDLYQAKMRGKKISVTSACIGGACPPTTGLRWLQVLESMCLVERKPDKDDKRRALVELTDSAIPKVEKALAAYT